ncbi:glycosyltransferase involved in cell wall biosynthesis [Gillisia mitskevichiae]|uniref:Glycosyltransferase involved in cell wall biosynthesis n=1 Tax=Gillisia mitskevichiae TaxID=270921 RepID=A0A495PK94_9FLAO|nr:glycosyltransferase family 4 protein [Gillisia mitskevichiae]RKS50587.1 glycosyltransferase involved in cell wall biosynthesis [Gillisia mitskevichiae]
MSKDKKVLFLIDTIQGSGAERSLVEIAKYFKSYCPVFVHIYKGDMLKPELERSGISVYSLNIEKKYGFKDAVDQLIPIYNKEKPDLIHATLYKADMVARKLKSKFPHIPLIGSFVNNSYTPLRYKNQSIAMRLKLWLAYQMDKRSANKVDFFISNSDTIKRSEGRALSVPQSKIEVIYRGRDLLRYINLDESALKNVKTSLGIDEGKNILINVSRLIQRKAQLDIINALPAVLKIFPDTILLIAGHGEYKTIIEDRAAALNLQNHVKLLGRRQDIPELIALSKIFVYPSYAEGLPGALIEAMMSSKLIVASDIGENLECVDENSALVFRKGQIDELAERIIYALKNFSKLQNLGENARMQAQEKFEIQNIANKYEKLYDAVKENRRLE